MKKAHQKMYQIFRTDCFVERLSERELFGCEMKKAAKKQKQIQGKGKKESRKIRRRGGRE